MRNLTRLHQLGAVPHWPHAPGFCFPPNQEPSTPPRESQKGGEQKSLLCDLDTLDVKDEGRVGRDAGNLLRAVRELGRDPELALTANLDASDTEVPSYD